VTIGLLYGLVDEGANLGREFYLLMLKIRMSIVDCLLGVGPFGCLLLQTLPSRIQRQVQQILQ
jgi:hypothetical protein